MELSRMKSPKRRKPVWKKALSMASLGAILLFLGGWGAFRILVEAQDIDRLKEPLPAASIIYDRDGEEASRLSLNTIEEVEYADIPEPMVQAIVAVEDKRFFEHDGMDVRGIVRAFATNLSAGGTVQGGSTITQQLAKNVFLSQERTWSRKWNEVLLAKKIEERYSKQAIITMYLNQIYYGEGAWGIERAAKVYFGKGAKELSLSESAMLAGLVKAPSALTPYKNPDKAKERRNVVLKLMQEQGYITERQYEEATAEPIRLQAAKTDRVDEINFPYYVDAIIREAMDLYDLSENEILHGGLRIYSEMDTAMQREAERVYADTSLFPQSSADQLIQSGSVLIDPRDGGIRALIGGRGEQPFRGFNRAVQLKRQPGSTLKPIAVYAPALEAGYSPTDTIMDEPVQFGGYSPRNAGGAYHGEVTLYEALIHSYNVPAVKLLNEIGIDKGMEAAERFGIPLTDGDRILGLALGGLQEGVSPVQMAEAFGAFANDGVRYEAHTITRIETADGVVLAEAAQNQGVQATTVETARTLTSMMQGVLQEGTGKAGKLADREAAGKSGTTQMDGTNGEGAKDNWFVGYTPQLVGAVWLGYDKTDSKHYLTTTSSAAAAVFKALMDGALKDEPKLKFPAAPHIILNKANEKATKNEERLTKEQRKEQKKEEKKQKEKEIEKRKQEKKEEKKKGHGKDEQ
ncbi:transglycosylase domain-containing protein [Cohnella sp. AR92]|uniref:transglycosylase domain-containing protein n=1 Tax=Cohnella sp. AR92 TaxID=648716 RepID=UPI000F8EBAD0|nr:PBP1A family penicillin-binding protein [Cohnella sp. AR92]RUS47882.1 PBP1A family penicillin-binding protein [Cohnella sp. AR92]